MKKLCAIFSVPSHYIEAIYTAIDNEYDCDWYFSDEKTSVRSMDLSKLKNVEIKHFEKIGTRLNKIEGIQKLLSDSRYDTYLIIFGSICISIWLFLLRAKLFYPHKKIYMWGHGWYGKENWIEKYIKGLMLKASTGVFVYGEYAKKIAESYGCDIKKLAVIHNSLNYDTQLQLRKELSKSSIYADHFVNDNPTLIFIGRLTAVKKLHQAIDALSILKARGEFFNMVFVGDGDEADNLKHSVIDKGLDGQVWLYGACYDERTNAELIYNADLCVSPGNVGLTSIHAMMFGTPVITHDDFSMQMPEFEVIQRGKTGSFFEYGNVENLADVISEWFSINKNNRQQIRNACFRVIDEDWNPAAQMNVIKTIIN